MKNMKKSLSFLVLASVLSAGCQVNPEQAARTNVVKKNVDFSQHIVAKDTSISDEGRNQIETFYSQFANKKEAFSATRQLCDKKQDNLACFLIVKDDESIDNSALSQQDKLKYMRKGLDLSNEYCQMGRLSACVLVPGAYHYLFDMTENKNDPELAQALANARKALQTACLSQTTPDAGACYDLQTLYVEEDLLVGEDAALIKLNQARKEAEGKEEEEEEEKLTQQLTAMSEKLCAKDHAIACFLLGNIEQSNGETLKARQSFQKSCDLGIGNACWEVGMSLLGSGKIKKIVQNYEQACNLGYWEGGTEPCAHAFYGYQCGNGVEKNHTKAKEYFMRACKRGYWNLSGDKCEEDYKEINTALDDNACKEMVQESTHNASTTYKKMLNDTEEYIQKGDTTLSSTEYGSLLAFATKSPYKALNQKEKKLVNHSRDWLKAQLAGDYKQAQKSAEMLCQATGAESMCATAGAYLLPDNDFEMMPGAAEIKTIPQANLKKAMSLLTQACDKDELYSCSILAGIYKDGKYGIAKNPDKAKAYKEKYDKLFEERLSKL